MQDAAAQLRRILALVPRVADGESHALADVARMLDVDVKTILGDLQSIATRADEPGGFVESLKIYIEPDTVAVETHDLLRPMRLTVAELHALDLGLTMLLAERPPDERSAIEGARARVRSLVAKLAAEEVPESQYHAATAASSLLPAVRDGLSRRVKIRIKYRKADAESPTTRVVRPYRLVHASGHVYLIAYCEKAEAVHVFRVDRIESAELLEERYEMPEESEITGQLAQGRAFLSKPPVTLRVRYSPKVARWIQERERGTIEADGAFVVEHPLADMDWAVRHVLQYGAEAEVIGPGEAREAIKKRLKEMAA